MALSASVPYRCAAFEDKRIGVPEVPERVVARDQRGGGRTSSSPVSVDLRVPRAWRPAVVVVLSTADGVELPSGPHVRDTRSSTEPAERSSRRLAARCAAASRHVRAGAASRPPARAACTLQPPQLPPLPKAVRVSM